MVRRCLSGLEESQILPRRLRSGRQYHPLPRDAPRLASTVRITTPSLGPNLTPNGLYNGSLMMDLYSCPLFRSAGHYEFLHIDHGYIGVPRTVREQIDWTPEVSYFIVIILLYFCFENWLIFFSKILNFRCTGEIRVSTCRIYSCIQS